MPDLLERDASTDEGTVDRFGDVLVACVFHMNLCWCHDPVPFLCVAYASGDRFRDTHALARLSRRRSRSSVPAQMPTSSGEAMAKAKHSRVPLPLQAALRCQTGRMAMSEMVAKSSSNPVPFGSCGRTVRRGGRCDKRRTYEVPNYAIYAQTKRTRPQGKVLVAWHLVDLELGVTDPFLLAAVCDESVDGDGRRRCKGSGRA